MNITDITGNIKDKQLKEGIEKRHKEKLRASIKGDSEEIARLDDLDIKEIIKRHYNIDDNEFKDNYNKHIIEAFGETMQDIGHDIPTMFEELQNKETYIYFLYLDFVDALREITTKKTILTVAESMNLDVRECIQSLNRDLENKEEGEKHGTNKEV